MPKKIITIANLRILSFRYETNPEPRIHVVFQMLDEQDAPIPRLRFNRWLPLSGAEAQKFEAFVAKHILPRLKREEGLDGE